MSELEKIYDSERIMVSYWSEAHLFEIVLRHRFMEVGLFKTDLLLVLKLIKQYRPIRNLWNLQSFDVIVSPDLQEWIDEHINREEVQLGVKYEAFILKKEDVIAEMFIDQVMSEAHGSMIITKMFHFREEGIQWLLNFQV